MVPEPVIKIEVPPPVVAAPAAGQGNAEFRRRDQHRRSRHRQWRGRHRARQRARRRRHGGWGRRTFTHARWISGSIRDSDYPRGAYEVGAGGTVYLRFVVAPNGRVSECRVTRSSGRADLDATTCRLIQKRFRYRPARDARGRPIADVIRGEHLWIAERRIDPNVIEEIVEE